MRRRYTYSGGNPPLYTGSGHPADASAPKTGANDERNLHFPPTPAFDNTKNNGIIIEAEQQPNAPPKITWQPGERKKRGRPNDPKTAKLKVFLTLGVFLAAALLITTGIDARLRAVVSEIAETGAKEYSIMAINACIEQTLTDTNADYNGLVYADRDAETGVAVLRTNVTALNTLKARLTVGIQEKMAEYEVRTVKVAIGTLTGSDLLADRGPRISIKIIPLGYVTTTLYNEFLEAGINQTLHRIMLKVKATVTVVLPGYTAYNEVETEFCLAETLIVGAVPGTYAEFGGQGGNLFSAE